MHRHPKTSIPGANSTKNTYSPSTCLRSKARWNTFFHEVQKLKKNYLLLFLLLLLLNSMNYFHREPETKGGVTKVSCKHRDKTQCTKSSAPFQSLQAYLQFGTELAYLGGLQGDKPKPHASRKMKKAGCGGEGEREQLVNMPKDFRQCSNKPQ